MQWRIHDFPSNLERTPILYFCHNFGEKSLQLKKNWSILRGIRLLRPWNEAMACGNLLCTTNDKSELSVTHNERESFGAPRLSVQLCQYFLGPSNWKNLPGNEACGGRRQSPINIDTSKVQFNESLGKFIFTGYNTNPSRVTLLNNGHGGEILKNTPFSWMIKGYIFYLLMSKR